MSVRYARLIGSLALAGSLVFGAGIVAQEKKQTPPPEQDPLKRPLSEKQRKENAKRMPRR
jgi:hypothetical protein